MSHTSFHTVIEEFPTMLFAVSIDGQFHLWNKESEQITGYSASEAELNKEFSKEFFCNSSLLNTISQIQKEKKDISVTFQNVEINVKGNFTKKFRFIVRFRAIPIIDEFNTWVIGFDETKQSEINETYILLADRFEMLTQATNDAIWEWDIMKDTLWWGEGLSALFGHPEGGQTTSFQWWADRVHLDDRDRVVRKVRSSAQSEVRSWHDEYQFKRKDGTYCYVQDKGLTIYDKKGKALKMIGGMTDITEKKIYEQSLIVKNQQLAEYAFFNSHKVRAPLARLMSCVNILEIDSEIDKETIEILKAIKLSADELDNEIRDIGNLLSMDFNLGVKKSWE